MRHFVWLVILLSTLCGCTGIFNPYVKPVRDESELFSGSSGHASAESPPARDGEQTGGSSIASWPTDDGRHLAGAVREDPGATTTAPSSVSRQSPGASGRGPCDDFDPQLCSALKLAEGYRVAYLRAASNQQRLRSGVAVAGLAAAASTLYYGLQGRDIFKDRVLRLSTLGATAYATGTFFTSSPRQQVYLHGATAMSCAIIAAAPFMVPKAGVETLHDDLTLLQKRIGTVRDANPNSSDAAVLDALAEAENTLRDGVAMHASVLRSGLILRQRIEVLANEVNLQTLAQLPDLTSLYSLAGSLATYAKGFGAERLTAAAPSAPADGAKAISRDGAGSSDTLAALKAQTIAVQRHLQFAGIAAQTYEEVGSCNPAAIGSAFEVEPADAAVSVEKGKTHQFIVTDSGHPSAKLTGSNAEMVELQPVQAAEDNSKKYRVIIKGLDVTGQKGPQLVIRDSTGVRFKTFTITVSQPAATPPPPPAAAAGTAASDDEAVAALKPRNDTVEPAVLRDPLKILGIQCIVGAAPDCVMGSKTRAAIKAFRKDEIPRPQPDDAITDALHSAANKLSLPPAACSTKPVLCGDPQ